MINRFESAIRTGVKQKNLDLHILNIADSYDVIYEHFLREFRQPERWEDALIITTRDSLAIAINNAAMDLKLSIPQQVQTIGIIGTKNSRMARPSISIFDVDYYEIGSISTRMLTKLLNGTLENNRFNFTTHFIKRDSSRS